MLACTDDKLPVHARCVVEHGSAYKTKSQRNKQEGKTLWITFMIGAGTPSFRRPTEPFRELQEEPL